MLWPLFHYVQDVLDTNPLQTQWAAYERANQAFCDAILPRLKDGDAVWVHDYHLMLLPTMLKSRMPSLRVGWFLHTPFPTSEVFRMLPMRDRLMRGLLGADLLGFHTSQYVSHFLAAAQRCGETSKGGDRALSSVAAAANTLSLRIPRDPSYAPAAAAAEASPIVEADAADEAVATGEAAIVSSGMGLEEDDEDDEATEAAAVEAAALRPRFRSRFSFSEKTVFDGWGTRTAYAEAEGASEQGEAVGGPEISEDESPADAQASFAHTAHVGAFPIGIAPDRFEEELRKSSCQQAIRELQERFGGRKIMLGVDRLDPIKGIPHKLLAFEKLLETHPEYRGEVVLVQIAVPSRLDVPLHQQLQQRLHSLAGRINGRFGSLGWVPIHYLDTSVPFEELVALYAASSAMVISSLRDGMNLVSFEWTVCQVIASDGFWRLLMISDCF